MNIPLETERRWWCGRGLYNVIGEQHSPGLIGCADPTGMSNVNCSGTSPRMESWRFSHCDVAQQWR
jgi:hypothetical protein